MIPIATVGVSIIGVSIITLQSKTDSIITLQSKPANALRQQVYRRGAIAAEDDQRALEDLSNDLSMSIQNVELTIPNAGANTGAAENTAFAGFNPGSTLDGKASKTSSSPTTDPLDSKSSKTSSSPTDDSLGTASPTDPLASKAGKAVDAIKKSKTGKSTSSPTDDSLGTASPTDPLASKSSKSTSSPTDTLVGDTRRGRRTLGRRVAKYL